MVGSRKKGFAGQDFSAYVAAIDSVTGSFDVIVIDGRAREACLAAAVGRLAPGGVIVFDNVERRRYRKAIASLGSTIAVDARWGRTACLPYPTRTALIRVVGA
jgi:predicted O-methyltransferase YrrM